MNVFVEESVREQNSRFKDRCEKGKKKREEYLRIFGFFTREKK
jgi:hypothetical protein